MSSNNIRENAMYEDENDIMRPGTVLGREAHKNFHYRIEASESVLALFDGQGPQEMNVGYTDIDGDESLNKYLAKYGL